MDHLNGDDYLRIRTYSDLSQYASNFFASSSRTVASGHLNSGVGLKNEIEKY